MMLIKNLVLCF